MRTIPKRPQAGAEQRLKELGIGLPAARWGKYDLSFELSEPEAYRRDVLVRGFMTRGPVGGRDGRVHQP